MKKADKSPFKKRNAQVPVILDEDDFYILHFLYEGKSSLPPFPSDTKDLIVAELDEIKSFMNMSYNSFLTHMKRLNGLGLVRTMNREGEHYKNKLVIMTKNGKEFFESFMKTMSKELYYSLLKKSDELSKSKSFKDYKKRLDAELKR